MSDIVAKTPYDVIGNKIRKIHERLSMVPRGFIVVAGEYKMNDSELKQVVDAAREGAKAATKEIMKDVLDCPSNLTVQHVNQLRIIDTRTIMDDQKRLSEHLDAARDFLKTIMERLKALEGKANDVRPDH